MTLILGFISLLSQSLIALAFLHLKVKFVFNMNFLELSYHLKRVIKTNQINNQLPLTYKANEKILYLSCTCFTILL